MADADIGHKEVVRLRLALVPIRITRRSLEEVPMAEPDDEHRYTMVMEAPIFLDDLSASEETKRDFYTALARMQIPWLHERVRTAVRRYVLGQPVVQQKRAVFGMIFTVIIER
jgi:hypothetical protein